MMMMMVVVVVVVAIHTTFESWQHFKKGKFIPVLN
jgi:hypothetical protein